MSESAEIAVLVLKIIGGIFTIIAGCWAFGKGAGKTISVGLENAGKLHAAPIEKAISVALSKDDEVKALESRIAQLEKSERENEAFKTENLKFQGEVRDMFALLKDDIANQFRGLYTTLLISPPSTTRIIQPKDQDMRA